MAPGSARKDLSYLLSVASPEWPLHERVVWLENLLVWIQSSALHEHGFSASSGHLHSVRIRFVLHLLERQPEWKKRVSATLRSLFCDLNAVTLFSQSGLTQEKGLIAETLTRIVQPYIPRPSRDEDASELVARVFSDEEDVDWISDLSPEVVEQIEALIQFEAPEPEKTFSSVRASMRESLVVLGAHLAASGLEPEIRDKLVRQAPTANPFFQLNEKMLSIAKSEQTPSQEAIFECLTGVQNCRGAIQHVFNSLEEAGVSVALVYRLERMQKLLERSEQLLSLLAPLSPSEKRVLVTMFLSSLIDESVTSRTIQGLIRSNLHLVSRKIAERTGASGEHYITHTRAEYFQMFRSGVGGGVITIGTAIGKIWLGKLHAPVFFDGLLTSLNYAVSFVAMQLCHFTLATKQPSMTASALAGKLKEGRTDADFNEIVNELACVNRTQLVAALGNVGASIPAGIAVNALSRFLTGRDLMEVSYAIHFAETLHPFKSLTIPLAALTGVLLWMGSLAAGALENWVVYHDIPRGIAESRVAQQLLGKERAQRFANWIFGNIAALGGNVALGFLLGSQAAIGRFFGLPLDVRHVTISACSLSIAGTVLWAHGTDMTSILWASVGILFIGTMNFSVSFVLALIVAVRARDMKAGFLWGLARQVVKRFLKNPAPFFFPPKNSNNDKYLAHP